MKTRALGLALVGMLGGLAIACAATQAQAAKAAPASSVEARLPGYLNNYLSYDPASKLAIEQTVYVSDDGKWFFDGDTVANPNPRPVETALDLAWLEARTSALYRT